MITDSQRSHSKLDGLVITYLHDPDKKRLNEKLDDLYQDKALMFQAAVAFVIIYMNFINDPDYYLQGIDSKGVQACL